MSIVQPIAGSGIFSAVSDADAISLMEFFLYYAAPVDSSPLSLDLSHALSDIEKNGLLDELCTVAGCDRDDLCFITLRDGKLDQISKLNLEDENFIPDKPKGFFWQYVPKGTGAQPENEFDCVVKHIRNAIAHGRVCTLGDFALFEDLNKRLTMRFVVKPQALIDWAIRIQERFDG